MWRGLTLVMAALHKQVLNLYNKSSQVCGSRNAIQTWSHLNTPVSSVPALLFRILYSATLRSCLFKNTVF